MQRIGFVVAAGFQLVGLAAQSVFEYANLAAGRPAYAVSLLSENGGLVPTSSGLMLQTEAFSDAAFDTLIFVGGNDANPELTSGLLDFARQSMHRVRRLASACSGVTVLAAAGVLDRRRVTTHWFIARELQQRYPAIRMEEDRIFIIDGPIWTSAGATAALDLALAMVEKDLGAELARSTAHKLVMHHKRTGGQSQHSEMLALSPKSDRIQNAIAYAEKNLRAPLSVEKLAEVANLSPRQFSRAFQEETGQSPAKAIEKLRLESARLMLEQSRHPIEVVARETGFADLRRMRDAFTRHFGQPPLAMRRAMRAATA
ncbi:GlxA family transcriptional regulator [Duganella callida]|uniref:Helix-turn-helix domain-containing protein n=1 Tax=Duganella callida TaxID=2561932 RepID=A0A4Y9SBS8_9BURK|nr:helix-turn-helix domain-containing protein [Duganella callida]TFW19591.1 helix-turn-helix domain-containing protein [Duganella callida]